MGRIQASTNSAPENLQPAQPATASMADANAQSERPRRSRCRKPVSWSAVNQLSDVLDQTAVGFNPIPVHDRKRTCEYDRAVFARYISAILDLKVPEDAYRHPQIYEEDYAIVDEGVQISGAGLCTVYIDTRYPSKPLLHLDLSLRYKQLDLAQRILAADGQILADSYMFASRYSQGPAPCCVDFALYAVIPADHEKWRRFRTSMEEFIYGDV